jgi:hypothetical protein
LEERLKPRFSLSFDDSCFHLVPKEGSQRRKRKDAYEYCPAWGILIRATNESDEMIHGCVANLAAIYFKEKDDNEFARLPYHTNASLSIGGFEPVNMPAKLNAHINIFAIDEIDERIRIIWPIELQVYEHLFDPIGIYKFTIQFSTTDAGHKTFDLELDWRGKFEKPRVRAV